MKITIHLVINQISSNTTKFKTIFCQVLYITFTSEILHKSNKLYLYIIMNKLIIPMFYFFNKFNIYFKI